MRRRQFPLDDNCLPSYRGVQWSRSKVDTFHPQGRPIGNNVVSPPPTLEAARSTHEVDILAYSDEFDKHVAGAIKTRETAVHILPQTIQFPTLPAPLLVALSASGANPPPTIKYLLPALHSARLIKTEYEIELIRQANAISSRAHEVIMRVLGKDVKEVGGRVSTGSKEVTAVMPGQWRIEKEAEAEAIFVASCRREGAVHQAYMPIVASAQHAATLHYCCNDRAFAWGPVNSERQDLATQPANGHAHAHNGTQNGHGNEPTLAPQVLLLDAGCEWRNYASDITRTTPVGNGGKFTPEARAIYELVLKMQEEAIDSLKPGLHWDKVQLQCHLTLIDGFLELGLFKGERADIINSEISSAFFPHGVGHSLGLDVHDVPSASKPEAVTASSSLLALGPNVTIPIESADHPSFYRYLRLRLPLATGMVLTVEPGIYFSPHLLAPVRSSPYIDHELLAKYESVGGVRIEDVLWITETGCQNFTMTGKSVEWIEKLTSGQA
ncbi:Creatinase aminopeptidase [Rhizoctonia solani]|uniref:Creatinase aminopeptidase n=2 Tax=Rhizoctonia solani TaxID=456999 RepID=A0A8H7I456_9AGAM|nr:Creatinase aminopeptidase [Rhizoctonia solani]